MVCGIIPKPGADARAHPGASQKPAWDRPHDCDTLRPPPAGPQGDVSPQGSCQRDRPQHGAAVMSQVDVVGFSCAACGKQFRWKPELAGKTLKCKCGSPLKVPKQAGGGNGSAPAKARAST